MVDDHWATVGNNSMLLGIQRIRGRPIRFPWVLAEEIHIERLPGVRPISGGLFASFD